MESSIWLTAQLTNLSFDILIIPFIKVFLFFILNLLFASRLTKIARFEYRRKGYDSYHMSHSES